MECNKDTLFIGAKVQDWDGDIGIVKNLNNDEFIMEYIDPESVGIRQMFIRFCSASSDCILLQYKVKDTRLARKMYPKHEVIEDGMLLVEVK